MYKYGKNWGHTLEIFSNDNISIHRAKIFKGHSCSKHYHQYKYNMFFIEHGNIIVYRWENDIQIETLLKTKESITIPPNVYHKFKAIKNSIVYEIYYNIPINNTDIIRQFI